MAEKFNPGVRNKLVEIFNEATINMISANDAFIISLNSFFAEPPRGRPTTSITSVDSKFEGSYVSGSGTLNIRPDQFGFTDPRLPEIQFKALTILAHELGHALSDWQGELKADLLNGDKAAFPTLTSYVQRMREEEGKAAYNQFVLINSLNIPDECKRDMVEYLLIDKAESESVNLYDQLASALLDASGNLYKYIPIEIVKDTQGNMITTIPAAIVDKDSNIMPIDPSVFFQKVGQKFTQRGQFSVEHGITYTYDEFYGWEWLFKTKESMFVVDFVEAQGQSFTRDDAGRASALAAILANPAYLWEIKVLLNGYNNGVDAEGQTHKYVGTDDVNGETLTAKEGGSALGNAEQHGREKGETLWGGKGVDIISGKGDDRLAGNIGDDILEGGAGNDKLYGGEGHDRYVFDLTNTSNLAETIGSDEISDSDGDGRVQFKFGENDIRGLKGGRLISKNKATGVCVYEDWNSLKLKPVNMLGSVKRLT